MWARCQPIGLRAQTSLWTARGCIPKFSDARVRKRFRSSDKRNNKVLNDTYLEQHNRGLPAGSFRRLAARLAGSLHESRNGLLGIAVARAGVTAARSAAAEHE